MLDSEAKWVASMAQTRQKYTRNYLKGTIKYMTNQYGKTAVIEELIAQGYGIKRIK